MAGRTAADCSHLRHVAKQSLQVSSEVYLAMQSRGFRNYPRTLDTFKMRRTDWLAARW